MKKLAFGALLVGLLAACGGDDGKNGKVMPIDGGGVDSPPITACNPLMQTGCEANEKCTWLVDAVMPQYVGHIGCAPDGTAAVGDTCMYGAPGATGYDDCVKGAVCTAFGNPDNPGVCKQLCDQQGGEPMCDQDHVCVVYDKLFDLGDNTPAAAGVCNAACDPLLDNDFDGSGALEKRGDTCGSQAEIGCYGIPSYGTAPATGWSCTGDYNFEKGAGIGLRHRVQCNDATGCSMNGTIYVNSCNQGYLPLLNESTGSMEVICVAMCKPANCSVDGCGSNGDARKGVAGDTCTTTDRVGTFQLDADGTTTNPNVGPFKTGGEHCLYSWSFELNEQNELLRSKTSDTVGFCYDFSKYTYDSDDDGERDTNFPGCAQLRASGDLGADPANPTEFFTAAFMGCVDSVTAGFPASATGKVKAPEWLVEGRKKVDLPRPLYRRVMR